MSSNILFLIFINLIGQMLTNITITDFNQIITRNNHHLYIYLNQDFINPLYIEIESDSIACELYGETKKFICNMEDSIRSVCQAGVVFKDIPITIREKDYTLQASRITIQCKAPSLIPIDKVYLHNDEILKVRDLPNSNELFCIFNNVYYTSIRESGCPLPAELLAGGTAGASKKVGIGYYFSNNYIRLSSIDRIVKLVQFLDISGQPAVTVLNPYFVIHFSIGRSINTPSGVYSYIMANHIDIDEIYCFNGDSRYNVRYENVFYCDIDFDRLRDDVIYLDFRVEYRGLKIYTKYEQLEVIKKLSLTFNQQPPGVRNYYYQGFSTKPRIDTANINFHMNKLFCNFYCQDESYTNIPLYYKGDIYSCDLPDYLFDTSYPVGETCSLIITIYNFISEPRAIFNSDIKLDLPEIITKYAEVTYDTPKATYDINISYGEVKCIKVNKNTMGLQDIASSGVASLNPGELLNVKEVVGMTEGYIDTMPKIFQLSTKFLFRNEINKVQFLGDRLNCRVIEVFAGDRKIDVVGSSEDRIAFEIIPKTDEVDFLIDCDGITYNYTIKTIDLINDLKIIYHNIMNKELTVVFEGGDLETFKDAGEILSCVLDDEVVDIINTISGLGLCKVNVENDESLAIKIKFNERILFQETIHKAPQVFTESIKEMLSDTPSSEATVESPKVDLINAYILPNKSYKLHFYIESNDTEFELYYVTAGVYYELLIIDKSNALLVLNTEVLLTVDDITIKYKSGLREYDLIYPFSWRTTIGTIGVDIFSNYVYDLRIPITNVPYVYETVYLHIEGSNTDYLCNQIDNDYICSDFYSSSTNLSGEGYLLDKYRNRISDLFPIQISSIAEIYLDTNYYYSQQANTYVVWFDFNNHFVDYRFLCRIDKIYSENTITKGNFIICQFKKHIFQTPDLAFLIEVRFDNTNLPTIISNRINLTIITAETPINIKQRIVNLEYDSFINMFLSEELAGRSFVTSLIFPNGYIDTIALNSKDSLVSLNIHDAIQTATMFGMNYDSYPLEVRIYEALDTSFIEYYIPLYRVQVLITKFQFQSLDYHQLIRNTVYTIKIELDNVIEELLTLGSILCTNDKIVFYQCLNSLKNGLFELSIIASTNSTIVYVDSYQFYTIQYDSVDAPEIVAIEPRYAFKTGRLIIYGSNLHNAVIKFRKMNISIKEVLYNNDSIDIEFEVLGPVFSYVYDGLFISTDNQVNWFNSNISINFYNSYILDYEHKYLYLRDNNMIILRFNYLNDELFTNLILNIPSTILLRQRMGNDVILSVSPLILPQNTFNMIIKSSMDGDLAETLPFYLFDKTDIGISGVSVLGGIIRIKTTWRKVIFTECTANKDIKGDIISNFGYLICQVDSVITDLNELTLINKWHKVTFGMDDKIAIDYGIRIHFVDYSGIMSDGKIVEIPINTNTIGDGYKCIFESNHIESEFRNDICYVDIDSFKLLLEKDDGELFLTDGTHKSNSVAFDFSSFDYLLKIPTDEEYIMVPEELTEFNNFSIELYNAGDDNNHIIIRKINLDLISRYMNDIKLKVCAENCIHISNSLLNPFLSTHSTFNDNILVLLAFKDIRDLFNGNESSINLSIYMKDLKVMSNSLVLPQAEEVLRSVSLIEGEILSPAEFFIIKSNLNEHPCSYLSDQPMCKLIYRAEKLTGLVENSKYYFILPSINIERVVVNTSSNGHKLTISGNFLNEIDYRIQIVNIMTTSSIYSEISKYDKQFEIYIERLSLSILKLCVDYDINSANNVIIIGSSELCIDLYSQDVMITPGDSDTRTSTSELLVTTKQKDFYELTIPQQLIDNINKLIALPGNSLEPLIDLLQEGPPIIKTDKSRSVCMPSLDRGILDCEVEIYEIGNRTANYFDYLDSTSGLRIRVNLLENNTILTNRFSDRAVMYFKDNVIDDTYVKCCFVDAECVGLINTNGYYYCNVPKWSTRFKLEHINGDLRYIISNEISIEEVIDSQVDVPNTPDYVCEKGLDCDLKSESGYPENNQTIIDSDIIFIENISRQLSDVMTTMLVRSFNEAVSGSTVSIDIQRYVEELDSDLDMFNSTKDTNISCDSDHDEEFIKPQPMIEDILPITFIPSMPECSDDVITSPNKTLGFLNFCGVTYNYRYKYPVDNPRIKTTYNDNIVSEVPLLKQFSVIIESSIQSYCEFEGIRYIAEVKEDEYTCKGLICETIGLKQLVVIYTNDEVSARYINCITASDDIVDNIDDTLNTTIITDDDTINELLKDDIQISVPLIETITSKPFVYDTTIVIDITPRLVLYGHSIWIKLANYTLLHDIQCIFTDNLASSFDVPPTYISKDLIECVAPTSGDYNELNILVDNDYIAGNEDNTIKLLSPRFINTLSYSVIPIDIDELLLTAKVVGYTANEESVYVQIGPHTVQARITRINTDNTFDISFYFPHNLLVGTYKVLILQVNQEIIDINQLQITVVDGINVNDYTPKLVKSSGGTTVSIEGDNLYSGLICAFQLAYGSIIQTVANFINSGEVQCTTPIAYNDYTLRLIDGLNKLVSSDYLDIDIYGKYINLIQMTLSLNQYFQNTSCQDNLATFSSG
jgi:hypothetical protein